MWEVGTAPSCMISSILPSVHFCISDLFGRADRAFDKHTRFLQVWSCEQSPREVLEPFLRVAEAPAQIAIQPFQTTRATSPVSLRRSFSASKASSLRCRSMACKQMFYQESHRRPSGQADTLKATRFACGLSSLQLSLQFEGAAVVRKKDGNASGQVQKKAAHEGILDHTMCQRKCCESGSLSLQDLLAALTSMMTSQLLTLSCSKLSRACLPSLFNSRPKDTTLLLAPLDLLFSESNGSSFLTPQSALFALGQPSPKTIGTTCI